VRLTDPSSRTNERIASLIRAFFAALAPFRETATGHRK
jgi:hypothetical protein